MIGEETREQIARAPERLGIAFGERRRDPRFHGLFHLRQHVERGLVVAEISAEIR